MLSIKEVRALVMDETGAGEGLLGGTMGTILAATVGTGVLTVGAYAATNVGQNMFASDTASIQANSYANVDPQANTGSTMSGSDFNQGAQTIDTENQTN